MSNTTVSFLRFDIHVLRRWNVLLVTWPVSRLLHRPRARGLALVPVADVPLGGNTILLDTGCLKTPHIVQVSGWFGLRPVQSRLLKQRRHPPRRERCEDASSESVKAPTRP